MTSAPTSAEGRSGGKLCRSQITLKRLEEYPAALWRVGGSAPPQFQVHVGPRIAVMQSDGEIQSFRIPEKGIVASQTGSVEEALARALA